MKRINMKTPNARRSFQLQADQVVSLEARATQIDCVQGLIWVTWPNGNERILRKGQSMMARSKGLICVQAFVASTLVIRKIKKRASFCAPEYMAPCPEGR